MDGPAMTDPAVGMGGAARADPVDHGAGSSGDEGGGNGRSGSDESVGGPADDRGKR